jgi:hypothetical protein
MFNILGPRGAGNRGPLLNYKREGWGCCTTFKAFCLQGNRQFHVPCAIQLYLRQVYKWGDEETMRGCELLQALPKLQGRVTELGPLVVYWWVLGAGSTTVCCICCPSHQADTIFNTKKKVYKSQLTVTASVQQAHINTTVLVWLGSVCLVVGVGGKIWRFLIAHLWWILGTTVAVERREAPKPWIKDFLLTKFLL